MLTFIEPFKSVVIGTIDENGAPFSSYAPFVHYDHRFYIFISDIAKHAGNLKRTGAASLFFIEDESQCANIFARKRISLQCRSEMLPREHSRFDGVMRVFKTRFGGEVVGMLMKMQDFNLYELTTQAGEAIFGFGEAYQVGGDHMETLVPLKGGGGHK